MGDIYIRETDSVRDRQRERQKDRQMRERGVRKKLTSQPGRARERKKFLNLET